MRVSGEFSGSNEGGSFQDRQDGKQLIIDFQCTYDYHNWPGKPSGFLASGECQCQIQEGGEQLSCKIINHTATEPGYRFTLRRVVLKRTNIVFTRQANSGYAEIKEIGYNEPFYIKVKYNLESEEKMKTVTLNWGEGPGKPIIVNQQPDKKIYLFFNEYI